MRLLFIRWNNRSDQETNSDQHRVARERLSITPDPQTEEEALVARQLRPIIRRQSHDTTPLLSSLPEVPEPPSPLIPRQRQVAKTPEPCNTFVAQTPEPRQSPSQEMLNQYDTVSENSPFDFIRPPKE